MQSDARCLLEATESFKPIGEVHHSNRTKLLAAHFQCRWKFFVLIALTYLCTEGKYIPTAIFWLGCISCFCMCLLKEWGVYLHYYTLWLRLNWANLRMTSMSKYIHMQHLGAYRISLILTMYSNLKWTIWYTLTIMALSLEQWFLYSGDNKWWMILVISCSCAYFTGDTLLLSAKRLKSY